MWEGGQCGGKILFKTSVTVYKKFQWPQKVILQLTAFSNIKIFTLPWRTRNLLVPYSNQVFLDFQCKFRAEELLDQGYMQKCTTAIIYEVNVFGKEDRVHIDVEVIRVFTSTLEKIAINILYRGVDGRPGGNAPRSNIGVIFRIDILQSFPWHSWMKLCFKDSKEYVKS